MAACEDKGRRYTVVSLIRGRRGRGKRPGMVEPRFGSDTTRFQTALSLPGNKERILNGALGLILGRGLGDKQLCLDYEL